MQKFLLPNPDRAIIPFEKLEGYSLNFSHLEGCHKAIVFQSALGIGLAEADELRFFLQESLRNEEAVPLNRNPYGQKYGIDLEMTRGDRRAIIRSIWIIRNDEDFPRLVTCYIP
jgi:hypothetical protein